MQTQMHKQIREQSYEIAEYTGKIQVRQKSSNTWESIGTCVFMHVSKKYCAITAGHVAASVKKIVNVGGSWRIVAGRNPVGRRIVTQVDMQSEFIIWSENIRDEEFDIDLAVVWLNPVELSVLQNAPRIRFYNNDWVHKEHGPRIELGRQKVRSFLFLVGLQGELTDRLDPGHLATVFPQLKYEGEHVNDKGKFFDFHVADLNAEENPMQWRGSDSPKVQPRKEKGLDNLQGLSGAGIWEINDKANREGNLPIRLAGIVYMQRKVGFKEIKRHITAISYSTVLKYLEKMTPSSSIIEKTEKINPPIDIRITNESFRKIMNLKDWTWEEFDDALEILADRIGIWNELQFQIKVTADEGDYSDIQVFWYEAYRDGDKSKGRYFLAQVRTKGHAQAFVSAVEFMAICGVLELVTYGFRKPTDEDKQELQPNTYC